MSVNIVNTYGIIRDISSRYANFRKKVSFDDHRQISLNDSGNLINDKGKIK
jgi:hypothetical protein